MVGLDRVERRRLLSWFRCEVGRARSRYNSMPECPQVLVIPHRTPVFLLRLRCSHCHTSEVLVPLWGPLFQKTLVTQYSYFGDLSPHLILTGLFKSLSLK